MHRRRYPIHHTSKKPSKLIIFFAFLIACILPYVVIKSFSAKKNTSDVNQTIERPNPTAIKIEKPAAVVAVTPSVKPVLLSPSKPVQSPQVASKKEVGESWIHLNTRPGDSMAIIFKRIGLTGQTLQAVMKNNKHAKLLIRIKPNQPIQFLIQHKQLERMIIEVNKGETLDITRDGDHFHAILNSQKTNVRERYVSATVQYSLYSTAKRQNIPYKLIQQMTDIFKQEVNLTKEVRGGDRFTIIYQAGYVDNKLVNIGDIVAVTYTHRGVSHRALRHVDANGNAEYFTPDGQSMKQGFSRYPVKFTHINSAFSLSRTHPILHYHRPHKGIDLAAPMGAPIYATGDGRVQHLGYESGYGNVIKISHHNSIYLSVYAHLSKFKKGLFPGSYVKRGQLIGYVGKSGLATAPHLHYEFHVNHHPKNPKTVPLPHAEPVPRRDLASFRRHADKLIEHLKLFEKKRQGAGEARAVG
jgi:murein DD-endopeptidase MepM/ murein hydrolase activator NlpD